MTPSQSHKHILRPSFGTNTHNQTHSTYKSGAIFAAWCNLAEYHTIWTSVTKPLGICRTQWRDPTSFNSHWASSGGWPRWPSAARSSRADFQSWKPLAWSESGQNARCSKLSASREAWTLRPTSKTWAYSRVLRSSSWVLPWKRPHA